MKQLSLILNVILFILVGILFYLHFDSPSKTSPLAVAGDSVSSSLKIAYVNIDSLEVHYSYFQEKKAELEKKQESIQNDLSSKAKAIQGEVAQLQKKAATMTQAEGEAAQKSIMQKQQALQQREQSLRNEFLQDQQQFNEELHTRLDKFLKQYNAGKNYTYILSYSSAMSDILYKDSAYNITADVIRGLNASEKK
jgi:outer membrane protein